MCDYAEIHAAIAGERKEERKKESRVASRRARAPARSRVVEREREGRRASASERDAALSHDRARCNARAAMHKQRRASQSAPAKVTRVMSRCPLCRTNSAHSAESVLSPSPLRRGAARRDAGREGEETDRPNPRPSAPSLASPRAGIRYWETREETLWLKASASAAQALAPERTESALCNARGHVDATSRARRKLDCRSWSMILA